MNLQSLRTGDRVVLGVVACLGAALLAESLLDVASTSSQTAGVTVLVIAAPFLASLCGVWVALRRPGAMGRSWLLFALMSLLDAAAGTLWLLQGQDTAGVSLGEGLYLLALLPAVAGLVGYPLARGAQSTWGAALLDGLVLCASLLLILALVGLSQGRAEGSDDVLRLVHPLVDIVLLSVLLVLVLRSDGRGRLDVVLVGLAFATLTVADSGAALSLGRGEATSDTSQLAYVLAGLLMAAGALAALAAESRPSVLVRHPSGTVAPLLAGLAAPVSVALCLAYGVSGPVEITLVVAVLALGVLRQLASTAQQRQVRSDLEDRVAQRTEDLRRLNAEHRRDDQVKKLFIKAVSHELRIPLTAIRGSLEMLVDGDVGELPSQVRPIVEVAARGSERLNKLVDDIIDLDRLESGTHTLAPTSHELASVIEAAVESLTAFAAQAEVELIVVPISMQVRCDRDRMVQVARNVISNALKFTPPGGVVTVSAELSGTQACVTVSDTGRGIPMSELEAVFEPFHQVEHDDARREGGSSGLGLSITRRIVEANGGRVWAQSIVGYGSRFCFTLPLDMRARTTPPAPSPPGSASAETLTRRFGRAPFSVEAG